MSATPHSPPDAIADDEAFLEGLVWDFDEQSPKVLYHGGQKFDPDCEPWYGLNRQYIIELNRKYGVPIPEENVPDILDAPFCFTEDEWIADGYADQGDHFEVRKACLSMKEPLDLREQALEHALAMENRTGRIAPNVAFMRLMYGEDWDLELGTRFDWRDLSHALRFKWGESTEHARAVGGDGLIFEDTCVSNRSQHTTYAVLDANQIRHLDAPCLKDAKPSMAGKTFTYFRSCPQFADHNVWALEQCIEAAEQITFGQLAGVVDPDQLEDLQSNLGYSTNGPLTLEGDYAVSFHKSRIFGHDCVYVEHSRIEHIFVLESAKEDCEALMQAGRPKRQPGLQVA